MTFYIRANGMHYDFGVITSFTDSYSRGTISTPIPSMPVDRTFSVETSASLKYTVTFERKCPLNPNNSYASTSDLWDNGTWLSRVSSLTNRWQARTNGYELIVDNLDTDALGAPHFENPERVFISDVTYTYKEGEPDVIRGTMTLSVTNQLNQDVISSMTYNPNGLSGITNYSTGEEQGTTTPTPDSDMYVMISSSDGFDWYILQKGRDIEQGNLADYEVDYSKQVDIIKSYEVHAGPSDPFEYATLSISRKELIEQCPRLDGDILPGCNKLIINGVSTSSMIVTKCRLTNDTYSLTAYNTAEVIRSYQIGSGESGGSDRPSGLDGTPLQIIKKIVTQYAGVAEENIITNITDLNISVSIRSGINAWTAVQLCAMAVNAKPFFAEGKFFLIDYTKLTTFDTNSKRYYPTYTGLFFDTLDLHSTDPNDPVRDKVTGNISLGNEGVDTIINSVSLHYATTNTTGLDGNTYRDDLYYRNMDLDSISKFTKYDYSAISIDQYLVVDNEDQDSVTRAKLFATKVGEFILAYRAEPQTSVGFTMRERIDAGDQYGWQRAFPAVCAAKNIVSKTDNIKSTAESSYSSIGNEKVLKPQKLMLSSYCHNYPDFTTDYWFGVIENVDLSQSTSNIMTHIQVRG